MYICPHLAPALATSKANRSTHSEHSPSAATSFPATVAFSRKEMSLLRSEISTREATALATTVGLWSARRSLR